MIGKDGFDSSHFARLGLNLSTSVLRPIDKGFSLLALYVNDDEAEVIKHLMNNDEIETLISNISSVLLEMVRLLENGSTQGSQYVSADLMEIHEILSHGKAVIVEVLDKKKVSKKPTS